MTSSQRIAAELRGLIERGELGPGDRVPSTRELTRRHGVAIATATRALGLLRAEGLVEPLPGVGTVVRRPRPARSAAAGLDASRIVAAAVAIADAEGIDGLSMRRLATELGTVPTSLYRHVADKDELLLRMLDRTLQEWRPPPSDGAGWRECLEAAARGMWWLFRRHPWLAPALSLTRPQAAEGGLTWTEYVLNALDGLGLDLAAMFDVHLTLFGYVRGAAINLESEAAATAATGLDSHQWMATQHHRLRSVAGTGAHPLLLRLMDVEYDFDLDALFERGLRYLLDGLAADLRPAGSA